MRIKVIFAKMMVIAMSGVLLVACGMPLGSGGDLVGATPRAVTTAVPFTVLTYNVAGLLEPFSSGNPATNTPYIGRGVRAYDIVQVQEDFNYHAALYENDNHPYRTATTGGMGFGSGLNTMSNFAFADDIDRVTWNTRTGTDALTPKGFTLLRLRLAEGVYVDLYNMHTNAGSDSTSYASRRANITQLVGYIQANSAGNAVIVMGDTNCRYTRAEDNIRDLVNALGGKDPWIDLVKGGVAPAAGSPALVWESSDILTDMGFEFVDKIFYRGNRYINLQALEYLVKDGEFRMPDGSMMSDHRPVYTKFQYSLAADLTFSDQFGGPHGTSFNDANSLPASPKTAMVTLRAGSRVDQIGLNLSDGSQFRHGGNGGSWSQLVMGAGEYLKSITLCTGKYNGNTRIFHAKFTTNLGKTLAGGSTTGTTVTYTAPAGWAIVGFHGRAGDALDKVGVIYAPVLN